MPLLLLQAYLLAHQGWLCGRYRDVTTYLRINSFLTKPVSCPTGHTTPVALTPNIPEGVQPAHSSADVLGLTRLRFA